MEQDLKSLITGVILAGGRGTRLGGVDKGLVGLRGRPLISRVMAVIAPQVAALLVNANRNLDQYRSFGYPVITDDMPDFRGPLAGIAAGIALCATEWLLAVPCDMPDLPAILAQRLLIAAQNAHVQLSVPGVDGQIHWACVLVHRELAGDLRARLKCADLSVRGWINQHAFSIADFHDYPSAWKNLNNWEIGLSP